MSFKYADIPDKFATKSFWPLGRHLWRIYKEMGWKIFYQVLEWGQKTLYELMSLRLDETILTAKETIEGKIENPEKVLSYPMFPPVGCMRADLQQGTMKLLYGESSDVSYVAVDDETEEIIMIVDGHVEDGIPVDWWVVNTDDELLDRRHQKLGYKLREIPKRIRFNMNKSGHRIIDILKDIRNERAPQWATSDFMVCTVWLTSAVSVIAEPSSWEAFSAIWDGISAKSHYGLADTWMTYIPWPPMIATIIAMGRMGWQLRINGLFAGHVLYLLGIEEEIIQGIKEDFPEFYECAYVSFTTKHGIPRPSQTLNSVPPNLKSKATYKNEKFDWQYPEGWITLEDLGLTIEEMLEGIYLDVTHETPLDEKIDSSKIVSRGIGRNTRFEY
ncbi:MAG: hypothetical protein HWN67_16340 [Candidatus Helarchaeota archaeon]|nr:hypothetical protein [Candidatus Helarchaeota archaeon]